MIRPAVTWLFRSGFPTDRDARAPLEVILMRLIGTGWLVVFVVATATTRPRPGLYGRHLIVLTATIAFAVALVWIAAVLSGPRTGRGRPWLPISLLLAITAASAALATIQPDGIWIACPYLVGVAAAWMLDRRDGALTFAVSLAVLVLATDLGGRGGGAISVTLGAIPWFLVIRLIREMRDQHLALESSRAAEARAAAAAERGRLAREMHDVLAHSLSALALQLESTRLLARDRGVDASVARALDQAHQLAVGGLDEARQAIAVARGDELPGPERLQALVDAFGEQCGPTIMLEVLGERRELAPDARLAVYRTAQEALTNVRRHAAAERVDLCLEYRSDATVLVIEDTEPRGALAPTTHTGAGYGLTGMRERAELLGGSLVAEPTSRGFRVELRIPATGPRA